MKKRLTLTIIGITLFLTSCTRSTDIKKKYEKTIFAFDTMLTLAIYNNNQEDAEEILKEAEIRTKYLENSISKTIEDSFVYEINKTKEMDLENNNLKELAVELIEKSIKYSKLTDGYFDITIEPLVKLWGFGEENQKVPNKEDIALVSEKVDYKKITVEENKIKLEDETTIDLGGIAKGYIADDLKNFLLSKGIDQGLINVGGNVLLIGNKPGKKLFNIGIRNPIEGNGKLLGVISVEDKSIVTSGVYERFFVEKGVNYHHIINPKTGYPTKSDILAVTIVSNLSIDGDALSTSVFLLGEKKGMELVENFENVEALFIKKDGTLIPSKNFVEYTKFELDENGWFKFN